MSKRIQIGIRFKILLMVIPIVSCGFTINGVISLHSSRRDLVTLKSQFLQYKIHQIKAYAGNQWENLENSGFIENPTYRDIVYDSIETYTRTMITDRSEVIISLDETGSLLFSTSTIKYDSTDWESFASAESYAGSPLQEYVISGKVYIGLSAPIPEFGWTIVFLQNRSTFTESIVRASVLQAVTFAATLSLTVVALVLVLTTVINPLKRFRDTITKIISNKEFGKAVKIEFPDEVGELAHEFNLMTSSLDLAYKKLKKYAVDEAVATREVFIRELETLELLGRASDYKDVETGNHIRRVSKYSLILSKALGQDESMQDLLFYSTPLHDIGKLGVPDYILLKKEPLSSVEMDAMKLHPTIGYSILENFSSKYLKAGAIIALSHHEKYEGTGYPRGIAGEDIPIFGRIVSIADVFDALTTKRPYKDPWPFEKSVDFIESERGKHFDPKLVDLFLKNIKKIKDIYS